MVVLRRYQPKTVGEITELHEWGWKVEASLQPILEEHLGETLIKTARRYDAVDFIGTRYLVELKARRAKDKNGYVIKYDSYPDWLLPASKINAAAGSDKRTVIYYYFAGDETLWYIWTDEIDWSTVPCRMPWFHSEQHFFVPKELWKRVEDDSGLPWE